MENEKNIYLVLMFEELKIKEPLDPIISIKIQRIHEKTSTNEYIHELLIQNLWVLIFESL